MHKPQKQCHSLDEPCYQSNFAAYHDNSMQQIRKQKLWFVLIPYVSVNFNSFGHVEMVSSLKPYFFLGRLDQGVNQYFVHILSSAFFFCKKLILEYPQCVKQFGSRSGSMFVPGSGRTFFKSDLGPNCLQR